MFVCTFVCSSVWPGTYRLSHIIHACAVHQARYNSITVYRTLLSSDLFRESDHVLVLKKNASGFVDLYLSPALVVVWELVRDMMTASL